MDHLKQKQKQVHSYHMKSNSVIYDIYEKGYDGLVNIELATPYLQQQVNRHGDVKIMVRVKCWVINKKRVKDMNIILHQGNSNAVDMMT